MHSRVVILGGGPGGYAAAFLAADQGLDVTLVEANPHLGGTCLLRGCIPSKALLHVAHVIAQVDDLSANWGIQYDAPIIDLAAIRQRKESLIAALAGGLSQLASRRKVRVIQARGSFVNSTTLQLEGDDESIADDRTLTFEHCIVATGSSVAVPTVWQTDSPRVMTSDEALQLSEIPASLLVIGGGYIGLELGSVYAQLGAQVSVVEMADRLLPEADKDLVKPLHKKLSQLLGERIHLSTTVGELTPGPTDVAVQLQGPDGATSESYEQVLIAVGRKPNSKNLGLENTEATTDDAGFICCNEHQFTNDSHILAIGDVCGNPMLAHKATADARQAVTAVLAASQETTTAHATSTTAATCNPCIPNVIFTDPEIAWAGLTETTAKREGIDYQIAIYPWAASGRAQAIGRSAGRTKWLIEPDTQRVLGCGIVGPGAGELISAAVTAIDQHWTAQQLTTSIAPHPTLSETLSGAAEVFLGEAIEIYKPKRA
jgi:dihydrolipoamide dehydrogenase